MTNLFLATGDVNDPVNFTFFIGCMAMMAASAFFFLSLNQFDKKWRTSVLVSGLITFIAAVHYYYMRDAAMGGELTNVTWLIIALGLGRLISENENGVIESVKI